MPISGLVLSHAVDDGTVVRALHDNEHVAVGPVETPGRVPIVLTTADMDGHARHVRWLERLPGVALVELTYIDYRDVNEDDTDVDRP